MAEQNDLPLLKGLQKSCSTAGRSLLAHINTVLERYGPKRVVLAEEFGIKSESQLSEALDGKGKHFSVLWLPGVVRYDRENLIASEVAGWRGLRVLPKRQMSDAEFRRRITRVLDRHNGMGEALLSEAMAIPDEEVDDR